MHMDTASGPARLSVARSASGGARHAPADAESGGGVGYEECRDLSGRPAFCVGHQLEAARAAQTLEQKGIASQIRGRAFEERAAVARAQRCRWPGRGFEVFLGEEAFSSRCRFRARLWSA
jgi:hypothetical protein